MRAAHRSQWRAAELLAALCAGILTGFMLGGPWQARQAVTIIKRSDDSTETQQRFYLRPSTLLGGTYAGTVMISRWASKLGKDGTAAHQSTSVRRTSMTRQFGTADACQLHQEQLNNRVALVIATAANPQQFQGLKKLVGSVFHWCLTCSIDVYNLGMTLQQQEEIRGWGRVTLKWERGIPWQGPGREYVQEPSLFAWKPFAILEAVDAHKSQAAVLWIDAGRTVMGHLVPTAWRLLTCQGHFLVQGVDSDMTRLAHPGLWDYFRLNSTEFANKPSISSSVVGFVHGSQGYYNILLPWVACASNMRCIAPPGATAANHAFEQTALSVIVYKSDMSI